MDMVNISRTFVFALGVGDELLLGLSIAFSSNLFD